jgi:hypothetical protein
MWRWLVEHVLRKKGITSAAAPSLDAICRTVQTDVLPAGSLQMELPAADVSFEPQSPQGETLAAISALMQNTDWRGPFGLVCDGILGIVYHRQEVPESPRWIEAAESPFRMRVLDCEAFCTQSEVFAIGDPTPDVGARLEAVYRTAGACYHGQSPTGATRIPCALRYRTGRGQLQNGPLFGARDRADMWNIYFADGHFYFGRSWSGILRYRAEASFENGTMLITSVEAAKPEASERHCLARGPDDILWMDEDFVVRQVDFLIKALLYGVLCPAPLPLPGLDPVGTGSLAYYALAEYGRVGRYPTYEDSTAYLRSAFEC